MSAITPSSPRTPELRGSLAELLPIPGFRGSGTSSRLTVMLFLSVALFGQQNPVCSRPAPGAAVRAPAELRSSNGSLRVDFSLRSGVDVYGRTPYCYVYGDNIQSPTLRVHPGDEIV